MLRTLRLRSATTCGTLLGGKIYFGSADFQFYQHFVPNGTFLPKKINFVRLPYTKNISEGDFEEMGKMIDNFHSVYRR